jgi:hypothetical protein
MYYILLGTARVKHFRVFIYCAASSGLVSRSYRQGNKLRPKTTRLIYGGTGARTTRKPMSLQRFEGP